MNADRTGRSPESATAEQDRRIAELEAEIRELRQARLEMEAIREISEAVRGSLEMNRTLKLILAHIESLGYDRVRLYLYDESQDAMIGAVQMGLGEAFPFHAVVRPLGRDPYSRRTLASNTSHIYRTRV